MKILTRSTLVTMGKVLLIALIIAPQALVAQCVYVDFTFRIGANGEVTFTDISGINNPASRTWSFGDGAISTNNVANPVHRYNITNATTPSVCFDVTLSVNDGSNTGVSQPKQVCIPISTQSGGTSFFVKIISPNEIYDGVCNTEIAKIIESTVLSPNPTAFEGSVLGGTPPYTYRWSFPPSAASSSQSLVGQGPHMVPFTSFSSATCPTEFVNLEVTDARGVTGTASMKISVRKKDEGPGAITVSASKVPICVGEYITFKPKLENPFALNYNYLNVSVAATYKLIVDNIPIDYGPLNRMLYRFTTAGRHTVGLEITDGGTVYRATPVTYEIRTIEACNVTPPIIPDFELKVNGVPNGSITLDARNNLCTGSTPASSITIKVPNPKTALVPPSDLNPLKMDCLPNYFFVIEIITSDGQTRAFNNPCAGGFEDLNLGQSNIISEEQLIVFGERQGNRNLYIKEVAGGFKEFTLPICFAACGPLVGCNSLIITVGRYNASTRASGGVFPLDPNGREHVCACAFPRPLGGYSNVNYSPPSTCRLTLPLKRRVVTLSSVSCAVKVTDNYPPLSISGINTQPFTCGRSFYEFDVVGKISGGIPFDLSSGTGISCSQPYKNVKWKAYYFNNPNREITGNFINIVANTENKKASVDANHPYFNSFAAGEQRLFIVEASVADWDGNIAKYSMLVAFDAPVGVTLPENIKRCKGDNITLSNIPVAQGGTATTANPYTYAWSNNISAAIFKSINNGLSTTSSEANPTLNLSNVSDQSIDITLTVTDNNGCSASSTTKISFASQLIKPTLSTSILTACANSSSVLTIGPTNANCAPNNLGTCLGGSGEYIFRWSAVTPSDVDYLSDPTIAYPKVSGIPVSRYNTPAQYHLTVSDLYGGCNVLTSANPVTVKSELSETSFSVNLGTDKVLCSTNNESLTATLINGGSNPSVYLYKWESTAPNVPTTTTNQTISLNNLPKGSSYTYKVTVIYPPSNCSATDEVVIKTRKSWAYRGYESVIAPLVAGNKGPLWASNDNEVFVNNAYNSGAVPYFSYSLPRSPEVTDPVTGNYLAITQGYFQPEDNEYNAKVLMADKSGCAKEFVSNTYYLLSSNPNVTVSTDKQVVCSGGEICFYLKLNTNTLTGHQYLPVSFKTPYNIKQAYLLDDGRWYYTGDVGRGFVEFVLTDASAGIYTAVACVKIPYVGNLSQFAFLMDSGLPNFKVTGDGTFRVEHQFNASPTYGGIRSEYRKAGVIRETYPRQIAYNFVSLGSEYYVDWLDRQQWQFNLLDISRDAYAEFAASRAGEVRIEQDVDIQEGTRYFHAFIDRCLTSKEKFKEDGGDETAYLARRNSQIPSTKGVFSVHPSPFTNTITLDYEVRTEKGSNVSLSIYNGIGQIVDKIFDNRFHNLGVFSTTYDTGKLQSGIYLFELTIDGEKIIKKSMKVD